MRRWPLPRWPTSDPKHATKKIYDILVAGMKGIKKIALEKTPGGEDHD
jgi:hypothetical protein